MANLRVENKPNLSIHEEGFRKSPGGKLITTGFVEQRDIGGLLISQVIFAADKFPFADKSLRVHLPHRGLINAQEIRRVNYPNNTNVYRDDINPLRRGLDTWVNSIRHNQESLNQLAGLAEECQLRGLLPDDHTLGDFVKEVFNKSDTKWLAIDINSIYVQFLTAWLVVNPALIKLIFDNGSDMLSSSVSATAIAYLGSTAVKETYLVARLFGVELGHMIHAVRNNEMSDKEFTDNLKIYGWLFLRNFIPTVSYALSAGYSFPRNMLATATFSKLLAEKARESRDKSMRKIREFLKLSIPNPYTEFNEYYLAQKAEEQRRLLHESPYPILTAAVVGSDEIDDEILTLSRAHWTQFKALAQFEKDRELPVIDMASNLPKNDKKNLWMVGESARKASRNPHLAWLRAHTEFLTRRVMKLEPILQDNVDYFMEELVKKKGRPIIAGHYLVGNCAIDYLDRNDIFTTPVVLYITDPHVHPTYLKYRDLPYVYYFTFDEGTKADLIEKGVPKERIRVTGFPIHRDLKINYADEEIEKKYKPEYGKKVNVAMFAGGLGGNQEEILQIAENLDYRTQKGVYYCGTNRDLAQRLKDQFDKNNSKSMKKVRYKIISGEEADLVQKDKVVYDALIVVGDTLEELVPISYDIFNWADVVGTKSSGDIGLEALVSGKIIIPFRNLAEHEGKIRAIIQRMGAIFEVKDLSKVGTRLRRSYARGELLSQATNLQINLRNNPPFPRDWQQKVANALDEIEGHFQNRYKIIFTG